MSHRIGLCMGDVAASAQFTQILQDAGYGVAHVLPGAPEQSWAELDLLLVDQTVALPQADPFLPVVLALPAEQDHAVWLDAGYDDVVQCPAQRGELLTRVRVLLRLRARSTEAERRNFMLMQSSMDAVVGVDLRGRIIDFNPAAENVFGHARKAVIGQPFSILAERSYRHRYMESFSRYVATGRSRIPGRRIQVHAVRADGEEFSAELSLARIERRSTPVFFAFVRDLTERKRAESGLAHLAAIVESSEEAIIGQGLDGLIATWNKGAERLFGYSADEAIGRPVEMLLPPERAHEGATQRSKLTLGQRHVDFDAVRMRKDGTLIDTAVRVSPILAPDGTMIGASTIAYDISARKRERVALQESEGRYRSLVAATTSIVWTADGEGGFVEPQASWEAYTGQAWPAHQGWGWSMMLHPHDRARIAQRWAGSIVARRIFEDNCRVWHARTASYRHSVMRAVPIQRADGSVRECIGTLTDTHDTKRAEEAIRALNQELELRVAARTADLAQANRELEAFSYSVSHDLRAPLRAIGGFTEILLDDYGDALDEEGTRLMRRIVMNVHRMDALVTDLLTFSRMSRVPVSKRTIAPGQMVRDIVDELLAEYGERTFDVRIGTLPPCSADSSLLRQVYVNLLSNAFKYTSGRDPAVITVDCLSDEDPLKPLVYVVRDNGVGFDMRFAGKLFQVFERLHNRQEIEGTGVGLALVRRIVERHGGKVWAESAPDQGASFYFTLESGDAESAVQKVQPAA